MGGGRYFRQGQPPAAPQAAQLIPSGLTLGGRFTFDEMMQLETIAVDIGRLRR